MSVYHNDFSSWEDVANAYAGTRWGSSSEQEATLTAIPEPEEVLFADYTYEDYTGDSTVIYRNGDRYFMVSGSHCSCYGLEGQWEPEEYTKEELVELSWRQYEGGLNYDWEQKYARYMGALAVLEHVGVTNIEQEFHLRKARAAAEQAAEKAQMLEGAKF